MSPRKAFNKSTRTSLSLSESVNLSIILLRQALKCVLVLDN